MTRQEEDDGVRIKKRSRTQDQRDRDNLEKLEKIVW